MKRILLSVAIRCQYKAMIQYYRNVCRSSEIYDLLNKEVKYSLFRVIKTVRVKKPPKTKVFLRRGANPFKKAKHLLTVVHDSTLTQTDVRLSDHSEGCYRL